MCTRMLHSDNPDLLIYTSGKLHITVLGDIRLTSLERLKVTLKLTLVGSPNGVAFLHHLDLYNSVQAEQLVEKSAEALELLPSEIYAVVSSLTTALETYRAQRLEEIKPMVGHRYVSSTERYQTSNLEDLKEALQKFHPLRS